MYRSMYNVFFIDFFYQCPPLSSLLTIKNSKFVVAHDGPIKLSMMLTF